jgi:Salmonella virulence plasmid 65kDa B protein
MRTREGTVMISNAVLYSGKSLSIHEGKPRLLHKMGRTLQLSRELFGRNIALRCSIILLLVSLVFDGAPAASAPAMVTPGNFNVSTTGAATYSIPIAVPPGTGGMVPALSLEYSSQRGDGVVGLGWAIAGLPTITRCAKTIAQDNIRGRVGYNSDDRFCLDGHRLIVINGNYGEDGSEYRTEIDGFSKIVAYGGAIADPDTGTIARDPDYFKIWTKAGQIMEFGSTPDSRNRIGTTNFVRAWAVNKISDTKGNYLTVTYTNDTTTGQIYPARIDYTGNASASLAPYNSVQFSYVARGDATIAYHAGFSVTTAVRLTNVKTYTGATLVSDYVIHYDATSGINSRRSRVDWIKVCDGGSGANQKCMPPTTFGWQGTRDTQTLTQAASPLGGYDLGDFNGDGRLDGIDIPSAASNNFNMKSGNADGTFSSPTTITASGWAGNFCSQSGWQCGDGTILSTFDRDGNGYPDNLAQGYASYCSGGSCQPRNFRYTGHNNKTGFTGYVPAGVRPERLLVCRTRSLSTDSQQWHTIS